MNAKTEAAIVDVAPRRVDHLFFNKESKMIFEMKQQLSLGGQLLSKICSYRWQRPESINQSKWRGSWIKNRGLLLTVALLVAVTALVKWTNTVSAEVGFLTQWGGQGAANGLFNGPFGVAVDSSGNVYVSDTGNSRIQKFNSTGAFITQWGTFGGANGNFNSPIGVAVDGSSNVYVADVNNNRIQKFSSSGTFISKFGTLGSGDGQFHGPYGVALDLSGNIYVADSSNHRIQKFDSSGGFIASWGTHGAGNGQFDNPRGLAVDHLGNIYVADVGNSRIQKLDSSGNYLAQWGTNGPDKGQFQFVAGVVADAWGYVYVTDASNHNVQKFTSAGAFVTRWGSNGTANGQFNVPFGVAVDSLGNVYVADSNNNRIQKFGCAAPEEYHTLNIGAPGIFNLPQGVAVDSAGNLYVADTDNNRIQEYTSSGAFITQWGTFGSGSGQFESPFGIAIDTSGTLYVSEIFSPRIQKFTSAGVYISQFATGGTFSRGIAVDKAGNVYVADEGDNNVRKFNSSGSLVTQWGGGPQASGDGLFYTPQGVAVDPWGYVYVTDLGNDRVQKFDSSGNFISKFGSLGSGNGQMFNARGIGVDAAGNVYVSDTLNHRIQKFTPSGSSFVIKWGAHGSHDGEFQDPFGITVDQSGNIYVADTMNVRIQKFSQGAPVANAGANQAFTCVKTPTQMVTLDGTGTTDPTPGDAANLEYEWSEGTTLLGTGATLTVPFAPGTHTISLAVTDDCNHSSSDTVLIKVTAYTHASCNTAPDASDDPVSFNEDSGAHSINVLANDTDYDNDALFITSVTQGAHGPVALTGGGAGLTYTPAADYFGSDSFTYSISDGHGGTATGTVNVTVNAVNDTPSFTKGANQTVDEDSGPHLIAGWATNILSGPPNESDQTLDFIVSNDNNALFSVQPAVAANGTLSYTSAADANGTTTVSVQLHDNGGGLDTSAVQTFTITVNAVNDPPSFTKGADQTISESAGPQTATGWATNISQGPGESGQTPLVFSVSVSSTTGNLSFVTQPSIDATTGTLTYEVLHGTNGTANLSVTLSDSGPSAPPNSNTSAAQTFSISVGAVNDAPVNTVPSSVSIPQDTVYTFTSGAISVADVDAAETDNVISVALTATNGTMNLSGTAGLNFTGGSNGSAAMTFEGTIPSLNAALNNMTFTPAPGYSGAAGIQMVSNDLGKTGTGGVQSDTDAISINVNAPTAIYINEILFNPAGSDAPNEYIELRGPANTTIPAGTYLLAIEGDAAGNPGDVQTIINLSGLSFGSNGFMVLLQNGHSYTTDAGATVVTSTTAGFGGSPGAIFQADGGATDIENASVTFMLIQTAVPPSLTDDIDVNDDGATDGLVFAGWNMRDSISAMNGTANARAYGAFSFRNSAGSGSSVGGEVIVNFIPSYVGRIGDSTGSTAADWAASGALGGAAPNWTLGVAAETAPASFAGEALNHIGASNFVNVAPVNSVPLATQNVNEDFTLTFNAGNANLISISDKDAGGTDVKVTLTASNGTMSLSGTAGLTFTPAGADNDGVNDAQMIFTGTIASINAALNGMTFTPTPNYSGAGSIQIVTDDQGNVGVGGAQTDTDTVNINVDPINDPPSFALAGNPTAVDEDSGLHTISGFASSISQGLGESGQTLTFNFSPGGTTGNISFASGPAIDATSGNLTYMTSPDTNGTATFNVTLSDSGSNVAPNSNTSAPQQFTITVNAVNDAPSFQIPNSPPSVNEDAGAQIVNSFATNFQRGPATATDETTQNLVGYTVTQTGTTGNLTFASAPSIDNAGTLSYTPTGDTSGTATFQVVAIDSGSGVAPNVNQSAPVAFTITVNAQNDAPVIDNSGDMSLSAINEDVPNASNPGTLVTDMIASAGGDRITDADAGAVEGIAVIAVNNTNGAWQYSIDGTNWLPFGTPDSSTARLLAADATTRVRFIPNPNFNGTVDPGLTFRAWDLTSGANGNIADTSVTGNTTAFSTATETASITVNPVNDTPTTTGIPPVTVNEDAPNTVLDLRASFNDVEDGNDLAYTVQANSNPSLFTSVAINNVNDNLILAYAANASGSARISIRGTDVGGLFVESTFTVTLNSSNDPPTFTKGADQTTFQNSGPQTVTNWATNISTGPADEAGQTLTFNVTANTNAALFSTAPAIDSSTGTLTYTGANNASGNATITVTLSDNGGTANGGNDTSVPQSFVITINPCMNPATVTNTNDTGAGSLRDAIARVCDGGTINFDAALNGQSITLTSAELVIDKNMTITGPGANLLTVMRAAGGTPQFRIFKNLPGKSVSISGLTMSNGSSALDGGGVFNQGTLTLTASSVTGNSTSSQGGGLSNAAGGTMTIVGSTMSANIGTLGGGGIVNAGILTLVNSTISGNTGDGLSNTNGATANLANDTFSNNSIRGVTSNPGATTNVRNTIVANTPGAVGDASGNFVSQGNNLIGKGDGSAGLTNGVNNDQVGTIASPMNALLAVLGNYGGPTQTHALLPGSPAIEAANNCVTEAAHCGDANIPQLTTDQRGATFKRLVNTTVDIGAFESRGFTIATTGGNLQSAVFNTAFGAPLLTTVSSLSGEPVGGGQVVFTAPANGASATFTGGLTFASVIDAGGLASASATANPTVGGPYNVIVTGNGLSGTSDFSLTNIKANQTINFGALANKTFGDPDFTVSAVATSGLPVSLAANGNCSVTTPSPGTIHITAVGSCTITTSQTGNANFNLASEVPQAFTIARAATSTALTSSVNPSALGQSVTFTSTVTSSAGTPSGTVQFKDNGNNIGPTVALNASGVAQVSTSTLTAGTHTITADYSGDTNFAGSTGTLSGGQVVKAQPSLSIDDVSITEGQAGPQILNFTVTLSAASSLTVAANFATADGTATAPTDYVSINGPLNFNPGETTKTISVTVNGDVSFEPDETFTVNLSSPSNATISKAVGTGMIRNDDAQGGFIGFGQASTSVNEIDGIVTLTVVRSNDVTQAATVDFATDDTGSSTNCGALNTGLASQRCDYTSMFGTLNFAASETQKTLNIPIHLDGYTEGPETFTVKLTNPTGGAVLVTPSTATVTINDSTSPLPNPVDDTASFVRQQYHDFLNRDADQPGLAFWKDNIDKCNDPTRLPAGQTVAQCIETQRIITSAAFFLSIEFRQTGGLVRDLYVAALDRSLTNNMPAYLEYMRDTQAIQKGVVVGQGNWEQLLAANQRAFLNEFGLRGEFVASYPTTDTPAQYVDKLYLHANVTPRSAQERADAIAEFGGAATAADPGARGRALLRITQNSDFQARELNRGFVQMQFFGYLRRNPNDPPDANFDGYNFWLTKLSQFNGDFLQAEMVKAFISSLEYRSRFGP